MGKERPNRGGSAHQRSMQQGKGNPGPIDNPSGSQDGKLHRLLNGGLVALFVTLIIAALSFFGVIQMLIGHILWALATVIGVAIIWLELISKKHWGTKVAYSVVLCVVMIIGDLCIVRLKRVEAKGALPPVETQLVTAKQVNPPYVQAQRISPVTPLTTITVRAGHPSASHKQEAPSAGTSPRMDIVVPIYKSYMSSHLNPNAREAADFINAELKRQNQPFIVGVSADGKKLITWPPVDGQAVPPNQDAIPRYPTVDISGNGQVYSSDMRIDSDSLGGALRMNNNDSVILDHAVVNGHAADSKQVNPGQKSGSTKTIPPSTAPKSEPTPNQDPIKHEVTTSSGTPPS